MSRFANTRLHFSKKFTGVLLVSLMILCLGIVLAKAPKAEAACSPATSYGTDTLSVNITSATNYTVWVRMMSPDGKNNQIDLSVDGGTCNTMNGGNMAANSWTWVDATTASSSPLVVNLSAGTHSLVLTGNETGMGVDRILLLSDNTCTPTGTGGNCTPAPTVSIPFYVNSGGPAYTDSNGTQWQTDQYYTIDNSFGSTGGQSSGGDGSACTTSTQNSNCTTHAIVVPAGDDQRTYQTERWGGFHYDIPIANGKYNVVLKFAEINPSSGARSENVSIEGTQVLTNFNTAAVGNYTANDQTFPVTVANGDLNITLVTVSNSASLSGIEVLPFTTTPPTVSLTAPTNGSTVSGTVTLSATASGTSGVSSVQFSVDGNTIATDTSSPFSTTWDSTTVANGSHTIKALATNNAGQTASSSVTVTVNNPDKTPPSAPTNLKATATAYNSVGLTWGASTDNVDVTSYTIFRGLATAAPQAIATVNGSTLSYTDNTVSASTSYTYEVKANDAAGNVSAASNSSQVTTPPAPTKNPPVVTINSPTGGSTVSGSVGISAIATDQVAVTKVEILIDGIIVSTLTSPNGAAANTYSYTWNTTTATAGSHVVTVTAFDGAGLTDSADVTVTVNNADTTPPSVPANVSVTATAYNSVKLSWSASTDNVAVGGYFVLRANGNKATTGYTTIATVSAKSATPTSYVDNTVQAQSAYSYEIEAFDTSLNTSKPSVVVSVITPTNPNNVPPSAPLNLTGLAASTSQINLSWQAPSSGVVTGYQVYENGTLLTTGITTKSFGVANLKPNTSYSFFVVAYNTAATSSPSNTVTVKTLVLVTTGTLSGTMKNTSGNPVAGRIKYNCASGTCVFAYANQSGVYIINNISPGLQWFNYSVPRTNIKPQRHELTITAGRVTVENIIFKR